MRIHWFKKRVLIVSISAIIFFFILRTHQYNMSFKKIIRYTKPTTVWEYVADFSNMKKLNPTLIDFNIKGESGNYDHWKYSVEYSEFLPKLSFIHHVTFAHFEVKPEGESFIIRSNHSTCFLHGTVCFPSTSDITFTPLGPDTLCIEHITFSCPFIFSSMCISDTKYQRDEVFKNLEKNFAHPHIFSTYMQ